MKSQLFLEASCEASSSLFMSAMQTLHLLRTVAQWCNGLFDK